MGNWTKNYTEGILILLPATIIAVETQKLITLVQKQFQHLEKNQSRLVRKRQAGSFK